MTCRPAEERTAPRLPLPLCALLALGLLKLGLLAWIGPLTSPDTGGYAAIADAMRSGAYWDTLDLSDPAAATLTARMAGYPAILAAARWLAGDAAFWAVALLQGALGMAAAAAVYRLALAALGRRAPALLTAAAYASGLPLVLDQTILTDGPYASILAIFACLAGIAALRRAPLGLGRAFAIGLLPAAALTIRDTTALVMLTLLPLLAVFAVAVRSRPAERLAVLSAVMLPMLIAGAGWSAFNQWRTGSTFLTTGVRTALLVPLVQMQAGGTPVFDGNDPVARALAAEIREWRNEAIYGAELRAARRLGLSLAEITERIRGLYLRSIAEHPLAFARYVLAELRARYLALSVVPAASLGTLAASRGGTLLSVSEAIPDRGIGRIATLLAYGVTAALGGLCWIAMAAGLPLLAAMRGLRRLPLELILLLALTAFHLGLLLLFAAVHIEARYLIAAQFVPPLALAYLLHAWRAGKARAP